MDLKVHQTGMQDGFGLTHCILVFKDMDTSVTCSGTFNIICYAVIAVLLNCNGHSVIHLASLHYLH